MIQFCMLELVLSWNKLALDVLSLGVCEAEKYASWTGTYNHCLGVVSRRSVRFQDHIFTYQYVCLGVVRQVVWCDLSTSNGMSHHIFPPARLLHVAQDGNVWVATLNSTPCHFFASSSSRLQRPGPSSQLPPLMSISKTERVGRPACCALVALSLLLLLLLFCYYY